MNRSGDVLSGFEAIVASGDDGSFQVAVPAGKGYLTVMGPTLDYIPREISGRELYFRGRRGGARFYAHDIVAYEAKAGAGALELTATLRPGRTIKGPVAGPAGEPVKDAVILSRQQLDSINLTWQQYNFIHARDGRFALPGFEPEKSSPVYFLDAEHGWGAAVEFSGQPAAAEPAVRLQPCGQARVRFVGPDRGPVAKLKLGPYVQLLMTPGSRTSGPVDAGEALWADATYPPNINWNEFATDSDGRITLTALIPGVPYRISDWSTVNVQGKGYQIRKDFTVKPGEFLDLGDILIEKPSS
jgi:hypothetical protein